MSKPKADKLYPPVKPAAAAAMEKEFTRFIRCPKRKARRLKDIEREAPE